MNLPYNVVLYNDVIFDNVSGAFLYYYNIAKKYRVSQVEREITTESDIILMSSVEEHIDDLYDKKIIIIGYNGKIQLLKKIIQISKEILMIENNYEIKEMYEQIIINKQKIKFIFDEKSSLSSLMWNYFYIDEPIPLYIKYLNNTFSDTINIDTSNFYNGLYSDFMKLEDFQVDEINNPKFFDEWTKLFDSEYINELIAIGKNYIRFSTAIVHNKTDDIVIKYFPSEKIYKKYNNIFMGVNQYKVMVCNWIDTKVISHVRKIFNKKHGDCDLIMLWDYQVGTNYYRVVLINTKKEIINLIRIASIFDEEPNEFQDVRISFKIKKTNYDIDDLFS